MERLPSELVECVLQKLAVQDPIALLRATAACKYFLRLGKEKLKAAFLASESGGSEQNIVGMNERQCAVGLDAEVALLGVDTKLAFMRSKY